MGQVDPDLHQTDALLAMLYPDGAENDGEDQGVREDPSGELGQALRIRGVFRELQDEEPPAAVTNTLLAMAAEHAPKHISADSPGLVAWWRGVLLSLMQHPALAAVASMTLVVGAIGTLYYRGDTVVVSPEVISGAPLSAGSEDSPRSEIAMEGAKEAEEEAKPAVKSKFDRSGARADKRVKGRTVPQKPLRKNTKKRAAPRPVAETSIGSAEDSPYVGSISGSAAPSTSAPTTAQLHTIARKAAAVGNCERVRRTGRQVRSLDGVYYDKQYLGDAKLKACLRPAKTKKKSGDTKK